MIANGALRRAFVGAALSSNVYALRQRLPFLGARKSIALLPNLYPNRKSDNMTKRDITEIISNSPHFERQEHLSMYQVVANSMLRKTSAMGSLQRSTHLSMESQAAARHHMVKVKASRNPVARMEKRTWSFQPPKSIRVTDVTRRRY